MIDTTRYMLNKVAIALPGGPMFSSDQDDSNNSSDEQRQGAMLLADRLPQLKRPRRYQVIILNDDYTPMEFVIEVLERFFGLNVELATQVMLQVHHMGKAGIGNFSRDVAETKAAMVVEYARQHEHPLLCQAEPII